MTLLKLKSLPISESSSRVEGEEGWKLCRVTADECFGTHARRRRVSGLLRVLGSPQEPWCCRKRVSHPLTCISGGP